jgi:hypothetical protein
MGGPQCKYAVLLFQLRRSCCHHVLLSMGLVQQFVKALDHISDALQHIWCMFPQISEAKVKVSVFTGPQI